MIEAQAPAAVDAAQIAIIQKKLYLDNRIRNGIGWFYWIAALSLVNTAAYLFGTKFTFVMGLAGTQLIDGFVSGIVSAVVEHLGQSWNILRVVGVGLDVCIASAFCLIGYFGRKGTRWPVIVGLVLYAIDAVVMLLFRDFLGAAFHGLALMGIWNGLKAMQDLRVLEQFGGESLESLRQRFPTANPSVTPKQMRLRLILIGLIVLVILPFVVGSLIHP